MIINLFNTNTNTITYNIKLSKIVGVQSAIYISELLNMYNSVSLIDNIFFKVDRDYIQDRTMISIEEQLMMDKKFHSIELIDICNEDYNIISIHLDKLISLITEEDESTIKSLLKKFNKNSKSKEKESKKQVIVDKLKDSIVCSNSELLEALRGWVETIYSNPNGYLSKQIISVFQKTLNEYTQGDLDLALKIVELATIHGYKDCAWAINLYEKENVRKLNSNTTVRVTEQKRFNKLSDTIF